MLVQCNVKISLGIMYFSCSTLFVVIHVASFRFNLTVQCMKGVETRQYDLDTCENLIMKILQVIIFVE